MWGVRVSEMEFLNYCWGVDLSMCQSMCKWTDSDGSLLDD